MCCYNRCYHYDNKWKYSVRRRAKIWLPIIANFLMLVLIAIGVIAMFDLIDLHLTQTLKLSALKQIQIQASTIAELVQNDIMLTQSGLMASAKTISEMLSDPLRYTDQKAYLKDIYKGKYLGEGYIYGKRYPVSERGEMKDFSRNGWYVMPKPFDPFATPELRQAFELCGFIHPFIGQSQYSTFSNLYGPSTTYFSLDTGFHCLGPISNFDVFNEPMGDPKYNCDLPELMKLKGWDKKYYSPVCRGWYKD